MITPQHRRLFQGRVATYETYAKSWALWYRLNEPAGVTSLNSGVLGSAYDAVFTPGGGAVAQVGKLGSTDAYLFDGDLSKITIPAGVYANAPAQTIGLLINASSVGEGSAARIWAWDTTARLNFVNVGATLSAPRATGGSSITTTVFPLLAWRWLFWRIDMAGDKKIHLFIGANGVATEVAYSTQNPITVLSNLAAIALTVGNLADQSRGFAGYMDEILLDTKAWSVDDLSLLTRLSGV